MSTFLFLCTCLSMMAEAIFRTGQTWIPITFALLCIACNIDEFRKHMKSNGTQHVYPQKRVMYDSEDPQHIQLRR